MLRLGGFFRCTPLIPLGLRFGFGLELWRFKVSVLGLPLPNLIHFDFASTYVKKGHVLLASHTSSDDSLPL